MQATNTPTIPYPDMLSIPNLPPNLGTMLALAYSVLYILMEPVAGGLFAPLIMAGTAYANYLTATYGATANWYAFGVHIFAWVAQFIGHGIFEGRAPALLDNLVQALFLAPFFVWLEVLFAFGYRPELKARLEKAVKQDISTFRSQAEANKAKGKTEANGSANGHAK